jgi:hypothetical protein
MTCTLGCGVTKSTSLGDNCTVSATKNLPARVASTALLLLACMQLSPPTGAADPGPDPAPAPQQELHNVTYRARIDGVARGALITYNINDTQIRNADPTMLPGRTFEAQAVLSDPQQAGMQVRIQWPYSANLHCEILVDDATAAQADQWIGPRLIPANNDPDYGKLMCGAPLNNGTGAGSVAETAAVDAAPAV